MKNWNVIIQVHRFGCPDCGAELMTKDGVQYDNVKIWCRNCNWKLKWDTITQIRQKDANE